MTLSDDIYEISLNPTDEKGVVSISITYFDTSKHLKTKEKSFIIDFNNNLTLKETYTILF